MTTIAAHSRIAPRHGVAIFVGALLCTVLAIVAYGIAHRGTGYAVVLVSIDDCRRSFDDGACRAIVERAQKIHAETAPSFGQLDTCEMAYGVGSCSMLKDTVIELNRYAPNIVAIALTSNRDGIVPLYVKKLSEPIDKTAQAGRLVYFRDAAVGRLMQPKIGGADAPFIADANGKPMSANDVRALHGK